MVWNKPLPRGSTPAKKAKALLKSGSDDFDAGHLKGYDGGKKVSGIKRHIAVDTNGLPHAVHITAGNVTDRKGAIEMVKQSKENPSSVGKVLVDGGYSGDP